MEVPYSETLSKVIEDRLLENWKKCDQLGSGKEYDELSDERRKLHHIASELHLSLSEAIRVRF